MNPIAYRGSVDPNTLRAHHGHQFTNTVDETNLPHIAILHCATCNQELARMPLDIRVITLSSMCFGDAMQHWQNRLFMRMVTSDEFSWERKRQADMTSPEVQAWEKLMWRFQQALPGTPPGEKWQRMTRIFDLNA